MRNRTKYVYIVLQLFFIRIALFQPQGSLLNERWKSLQKRNIIAPSQMQRFEAVLYIMRLLNDLNTWIIIINICILIAENTNVIVWNARRSERIGNWKSQTGCLDRNKQAQSYCCLFLLRYVMIIFTKFIVVRKSSWWFISIIRSRSDKNYAAYITVFKETW